jgi:hypothetical protein
VVLEVLVALVVVPVVVAVDVALAPALPVVVGPPVTPEPAPPAPVDSVCPDRSSDAPHAAAPSRRRVHDAHPCHVK